MDMGLSIIVAVAKNGVIGKTNALPWYLPAELTYFKQKTMGHPIIMGRKTHESIGRALPGRRNIVITKNADYQASEGAEVVNALDEAIHKTKDSEEVFIIGGAEIYKLALPKADKLYLTKVNADTEGDKIFEFDEEEWKQTFSEKHQKDEKNKYDYEFTVWERKK